ncbi:hypothetical protein CBR_g50088 [Chara braunii]|uniref:ADF-H domain-containing protein n=1 Tax=Chara braunii TaxID=69332 RepID=A0A388M629_CHABU|nr:hypothetical protein CBR_g50088 [Chara braunii]|eukprot:GBG89996.1 hypothetical protein CBR_g50088 [Chara braunii]
MAMLASAYTVEKECKLRFLELQRHKEYPYITYKIDRRAKTVIVDKCGRLGEGYDDLIAALPENEPRYAVFDYDYTTPDNCEKSKIIFIFWSPDKTGVRTKMVYALSRNQVREELDGVQIELQATEVSELDLEIIKAKAR